LLSETATPANGEPEAFLERKRRAVANGSRMGISLSDIQMVAKLAHYPTPSAHDTQEQGKQRRLTETGRIQCHNGDTHSLNLPGPRATDGSKGGPNQTGGALPADAAQSVPSGWATPSARDWKSESATEEFNQERDSHPRGKPLSYEATLAGWGTPRSQEIGNDRSLAALEKARENGGSVSLEDQVQLVSPSRWATPTSGDAQKLKPFHDAPQPALAYQCHMTSGETMTSLNSATGKRAVLNPGLSRWLMGYPVEWDDCVPLTTTRRRG